MTSRTALILFVVLSGLLLDGCGGGSNDGGDSGVDSNPLLTTSSCTNNTQPCFSVSKSGLIASCLLQTTNCAVDLDDVVSQVGNQVNDDTVMWIQAWGARGGGTIKGTGGGAGGYAQTTTTVNDIKSLFDGSAQLYYYLGHSGGGGEDHCGSAGGSATNVTFVDLTQSPANPPSLASPPTYLVAGGGGGGCGGNGDFGCFTVCTNGGGAGGIATAGLGINGEGTGGEYASGMGGQQGIGGASHCIECGGGNETSGLSGFGGRGGSGGNGQSCSGPGAPEMFYNIAAASALNWAAGQGGNGSSNGSYCDAGGGGGGGGWGGGGGGGHGNTSGSAIPGAGGGSYAIYSTRASSMAPSNVAPAVPCNPSYLGCVQVQFVLTPPVAIEPVMLPGPNGPTDCTSTSQPWSVTAGAYELKWQGDGNFVLYKNGQGVWDTGMEQVGNKLCFQGDGNLVLYSTAVWSTVTDNNHHGGNGGRLLSLWTNGLLQITDPWGAPLWAVGPFD